MESMARDRNTIAKRQREVAKKRKADEKRERRLKKKQSDAAPHSSPSEPLLDSADIAANAERED